MAKKAATTPAKKPARPRKAPAKKPVAPKPAVEPSGVLKLVAGCFLSLGVGLIAGVMLAGGIAINPTPPGPNPAPVPEPIKSFRVIFVKESGATLSADQSAIPGSKEIRDYLEAKTTPEANQPGWREYDPEQQTANEQKTMKALWEAVKPKLIPPPCLVVEVNGKATVMPFPATVADCMTTLKKAAGE